MKLPLLAAEITDAVNKNAAALPDDLWGKFLYGLQIALVGIAIVFLVLILLMVIIYLFKVFFYKPEREDNKTKEETKAIPENVTTVQDTYSEDENEIAAVIAAVISSYYDSQKVYANAHKKYVIKSFKRVD